MPTVAKAQCSEPMIDELQSQCAHCDSGPLKVVALIFSLTIGGAERLVVDWAIASKKSGNLHVGIVVVNAIYNADLVNELRTNGVEVFLLDRKPGSLSITPLISLLLLLRRIRPDVLHAHEYASLRVALALKAFFPHMSIFATIHNTGFAQSCSKLFIVLANLVGVRFIAVSEAVANDWRSVGLKNFQVIYNGLNIERFRRVFKFRRPVREIKLVCVARLNRRQKGQDVLLAALKECVKAGMDVSCSFVAGPSSPGGEELKYLQQMAADLGVTEKVRFYQDRTDVENLLDAANVLVLPSRSEGFGLVVVEAMAAGLPVIASNIDGPKEIISDGQTGFLVPADDAAALARTIACVVERPDLEQICIAAAARAGAFDITSMCERYFRAYMDDRS